MLYSSDKLKLKVLLRVISGHRREVDENNDRLVYDAASSGNLLPTFRDNLSVTSLRVNGSKSLPRNVGNKLPLPDA